MGGEGGGGGRGCLHVGVRALGDKGVAVSRVQV